MPVKKGKLKPNDYATIQKNFTYICDEVDARELVIELWQENVLTFDDVEEIQALPSQGKRTEAFLYMILRSGSGESYGKFLKVLKRQYEEVAEKLEESALEGAVPHESAMEQPCECNQVSKNN